MPDYGYNENPYSEMDYYRRQQAMQRAQQQQPTPLERLQSLAVNKAKDKVINYGIDRIGSMVGGGGAASQVATQFPSVFNTGASAATQLPTGGITPLLNSGGYAGIGEGGALTQGAAVPVGPGYGAMAGNMAGGAVAAYNVMDALGNIGSRGGKGTVEGLGTGAGTALGYYFGGPLGAGIGSVLGRTAGRGIASVADRLGAFQKSTKEYQQDKTDELRKAGIRDEFIQARIDGGFGSGYKDNPESYGRKFGMIDEKGVLTEAGKKDAASNWGSPDILKAIGNDYFDKYNEKQRYQITQGALDRGLLKGHKGDVILTDDDAFLASVADSLSNNDYGAKYDAWKAQHDAWKSGQAGVLASKSNNSPQQGAAQSGQGSQLGTALGVSGQMENGMRIDPGYSLPPGFDLSQLGWGGKPWTPPAGWQNYSANAESAKRQEIAKSLLGRHKARLQSRD